MWEDGEEEMEIDCLRQDMREMALNDEITSELGKGQEKEEMYLLQKLLII
jgi:hypothetical protein